MRISRDQQQNSTTHMTRDNVRKVMDFLARSGDRNLRLLGGEPTQHPELMDIVKEGLSRDFHIHIFTNCMMSRKVADFLGEQSPDRLSVLANISPQANDTQKQKEKACYALERLGQKAQVGITLTSPEFEFDFLLNYINRFKLRKRIRIGIAQPIVGAANDYLKPSEYRKTGRAIVRMAQHCIKQDILIGFDCGLTLCMFSEDEIGILAKCSEGFKIVCKPIIDIGPNLEIWHCFPLSEVLNSHLDNFETRNDIEHFYQIKTFSYRTFGCMPECLGCDYLRRGQCTGGCLAHSMNSLKRLPPRYAEDAPVRAAGALRP